MIKAMARLQVSPEEFQTLAQRVTDVSTRYLADLGTMPAYPKTSGREVADLFDRPLPRAGEGDRTFADLEKVIAHCRPNVPRFYAYVLGAGDPVAALGDYFASILNQNVTAWRSSPAAVAIEPRSSTGSPRRSAARALLEPSLPEDQQQT